MDTQRRKFQGVLNILSFNRHFYFIGLAILFVIVISRFWIQWPWLLFNLIIIAFLYGLIMPLVVSAYVYDFSGYYYMNWLNRLVPKSNIPGQLVNINAGFDETSFILAARNPEATMRVFDFYNAKQHTEPAIKRARKVSLFYPDTQQIASDHIPMEDHSVDVVFLLSAVHEIRAADEKVRFLAECRRICKPDGKVIMVEHLRDFPNFVAFSVGVTHFFSAQVWKTAFQRAGFTSIKEEKFTPFMSVFSCTP